MIKKYQFAIQAAGLVVSLATFVWFASATFTRMDSLTQALEGQAKAASADRKDLREGQEELREGLTRAWAQACQANGTPLDRCF